MSEIKFMDLSIPYVKEIEDKNTKNRKKLFKRLQGPLPERRIYYDER